MRPYAAAQLIGKVKNATPGMVIATMAHGIEAAIEAAVSTETDPPTSWAKPTNVQTAMPPPTTSVSGGIAMR